MDLDGDGVLSLFEMVYFYEEVLQRLQEMNIDCLSVENTVCQILDMVNPKERGENPHVMPLPRKMEQVLQFSSCTHE